MKKRLLSLFLAIIMVCTLLPMSAFAETVASGTCGDNGSNVTWALDGEGTLTISGTGEMDDYSLDGAPWYSRGDSVSRVIIEGGVTSIGDDAFFACRSLKSVSIPNSVTSIGGGAFYNCSSLTNVTIGNSVTSIGGWAFSECSNLTSVSIPNSVTSIGNGAFYNCDSLKSVTIPNSVTSISDDAFGNCDSLKSVTIPDSVTSIGNYAFGGCGSLESVAIPNSVTSIDYSFRCCYSLTSITVASENKHYSSKDGVLFNKDKTELIQYPSKNARTSYTIPNSVTSIRDYAFYVCSSLTSMTIPDSVTSISDDAFCVCSNLTSITVASANKSYSSKDGVLFNKDKTILIKYPIGKARISYSIPNSVTSIGNGAFDDCSSLTSVSIPNSVTSIGNYAFHYCRSLTNVTIPNSVTSIGECAFIGCSSLTSATIGNSVTSIGGWAFSECSNLTSVSIPNSVTSIGNGAFYSCSSLKDAYYSGTEAQWKAISIGAYNDPLLNATLHCSGVVPIDKNVTVTYQKSEATAYTSSKRTKPTATETFYYSDSFFKKSSYTYNHDLAIMSLGMTMSSVNNLENGTRQGAKYLKQLFKEIGIADADIHISKNYAATNITDDTCQFGYGVKKLDNGEYLVPLVIRSCEYCGGWASNCRVYGPTYPNYSQGFKGAADTAYSELSSFIGELKSKGIDGSKINVWVMGFSRGGATSNLVGADLNENASKLGISKENIFVYTFATPNTVKKNCAVAYQNIHNIVSQIDIVPRVPLATSGWDYTKYGITHYLPCQTTAGTNYNKLLKNMQAEFNKIMSKQGVSGVKYSPIKGQEVAIDLLIDYLDDVIPSSNYYQVSGIQRFLSTFMGNKYTNGDNDALLQDFIEEVFGNYEFEHKGLLSTTKVNTADFLNYFIENMKTMSTTEKIAAAGYILDDMSYIKNGESDPVLAKKVADLVYNLLSRYSIYLAASANGAVTSALVNEKFNAYNDLIALIASVATDGRNSSLLMQHWPEEYLAWMRSGNENTIFTNKDYKHTSVKCPVDITVYDSEGNIVARVINDEVDTSIEDSLLVMVDESGEKEIYMPNDDEYRIEVTAREEGTVDIVSEMCSVDGETYSTECYIEMPMVEDQLFVVEETPEATTVETAGEVIEPDCTAYEEPTMFTIKAEASEGGTVNGAGEYEMGKTVQLIPAADEDYRFAGWYENGELISNEETLKFSAVADRTVSAKFEKHNHNWSECDHKDASCIEKGYVIYGCSGCTKLTYDEYPTVDHVFKNGVCTICGEIDPDFIPTIPTPTISIKTDNGKPTLKWAAVDGAEKYEVYRATSKTGNYSKYYTTSSTSYTNTSAVAGYTYYYKVKAISANGNASDYSAVKSITCDCAQPVPTISTTASSGKPTLKWATVDGAAKYEIWRATSSTGTYSKYYTTTNTSYTNSSAVAGYTYYYKVKAICGKSSYGDSAFSAVKSITCDCAQPVVTISTTASSGKPTLKWSAVDGATKYEIWRATSKDGTYTKMYTTSSTSYTNSSAVAGKTYYYKVKAICGKSSYGDSAFSAIKSITCDCARPVLSITTSSGHPKLSWKAVDGATKYEVYRATSSGGSYTKLGTTSNLSYTNTGAKAGTTYYYKVKAVCGASSYGNSAYSTVVSIKAK